MTSRTIKYFEITQYRYSVYEECRVQTKIRPPAPIDQWDFAITMDGIVIAKRGYMWDGASGPTIQRKENKRGSLIHDILAESMRQGLLPETDREAANEELVRLCIEDGMWAWWARHIYGTGVSLTHNWYRRTTKPEHKIEEAPYKTEPSKMVAE